MNGGGVGSCIHTSVLCCWLIIVSTLNAADANFHSSQHHELVLARSVADAAGATETLLAAAHVGVSLKYADVGLVSHAGGNACCPMSAATVGEGDVPSRVA